MRLFAWPRRGDLLFVGVCALVVWFYAWKCQNHVSEFGNTEPSGAYYNLMVDGFRAGQLNLKVETPIGLTQLRDPWDPEANFPFRKGLYFQDRLHDTTYFEGKIYLYFSATPALLLFWPYHAITGGYLEHATAVAIFCSGAFLIAAGLWRALCRRYFPALHPVLAASGVLALGMANSVPVMMERPDLYEVPVSCALALMMAALAAMWRALHDPLHLVRWLALAGSAFALACSARPSLLPAAPALLIPLIAWWRETAPGRERNKRLVTSLAALATPIAITAVALALYNHARFHRLLEFGQGYQLAADRQDGARHFSPAYLWYNFRLYFLSLVGWSRSFPFVQIGPVPPMPPGHGAVDLRYGILTNIPVTLFAFALPILWRRAEVAPLRWFIACVAICFAAGAIVLCAFYGTTARYQVEFHPMLLLLAVIAFGGIWQDLKPRFPLAAPAIGVVWGCCLAYSVGVSVLLGFIRTTDQLNTRGAVLFGQGDRVGALRVFEKACRFDPSVALSWSNAATVLEQLGETDRAIEYYQDSIRLNPNSFEVRNNFAALLRKQRRFAEAIAQFQEGIRVTPDAAELHYNLGLVFRDIGDHQSAVGCFGAALRLRPQLANAHMALALSLRSLGRLEEAQPHYHEARRIDPTLPEFRF